jgi:hypothetical protein
MTVISESEPPADDLSSPARGKMRMLEQMAEALEDQVAGLYLIRQHLRSIILTNN